MARSCLQWEHPFAFYLPLFLTERSLESCFHTYYLTIVVIIIIIIDYLEPVRSQVFFGCFRRRVHDKWILGASADVILFSQLK